MNENVIFTPGVPQPPNPQPVEPRPDGSRPAGPQPMQASGDVQNTTPGSLSALPQAAVPPGSGQLPSPSKKSIIIKIVIGVIIGALIVFSIIRFVLPLFGGNNAQSGKVTLIYWGLWEDPTVVKPIIDDFQRQHPNITITYSKQDIKQYRQRLSTRIENGDGPDIFRYHNTWVPMLSSVLLPLSSDVIKPNEFKTLYAPVIQNDLIKSGAIYGIPLSIDTLAMFVNKEIIDAGSYDIPKDWEDFIRIAKSVTVQDAGGSIKTAGAAMGTYDNIAHASDIIAVLLLQNGVNVKKMEETKQYAVEALEFYTKFATESNNVWSNDLESSTRMFAAGNLAMYFGYSWDIFALQALNPQLKFEVHPMPTIPGAKPLTVASYWVEGVSANSKHKKESLLFMQYLSQKEVSQRFYKSVVDSGRPFGEIYARKDLQELLKDDLVVYPFAKQTDTATSTIFSSDTYDDGINSQANAYLADAVRFILNGGSVESAVDTFAQGVIQKLQQYGQQ
ncbi:MAG TPA: extracellular solute-binding protein [Patescibacteria group bacterium]|nr:extracellular solute-binding protein [Patescibacteria group bacterium]